jgi:hypothetical protein
MMTTIYFTGCLARRYCDYPVRSGVTYRNNKCGKRAAYTTILNSKVGYVCTTHLDQHYKQARFWMESELKKHGVIE